jgi:orotidine-5'-phosphate decarboxylase
LLETARSLLPRAVLLLPGVGAQGGRLEDLSAAFTAGPASALPSASRSVLYADRGAGWQEAAAAEAERLAGELRAVAAVG